MELDGQTIFWELYKEDVADPKFKWRKSCNLNYDKQGFKGLIYQKPSPYTGNDMLKLELNFKNATID